MELLVFIPEWEDPFEHVINMCGYGGIGRQRQYHPTQDKRFHIKKIYVFK